MLEKVFMLFLWVIIASYIMQYLERTSCIYPNRENMSNMRIVSTSNYPHGFATHIPTNYAINTAIDTYRNNNKVSLELSKQSTSQSIPHAYNTCFM